jgi:hypothetical protein
MLYRLAELVEEHGDKTNQHRYLVTGITELQFNQWFGDDSTDWATMFGSVVKKLGVARWEIDGYFMDSKDTLNQKRKKDRERQQKYRNGRVKTKKVKTEEVDTKKPEPPKPPKKGDGKDEDGEKFYITSARKKLKGQHLEWFNLFWKAWITGGTYGDKPEAAERFRQWCSKDYQLINEKNLSLICEAAEYEAKGRKKHREQNNIPIYPQGWLTKRRWENFQSRRQEGTLSKKSANRKEGAKQLPQDWHDKLGGLIYKQWTGLIDPYEAGHFSDYMNLPPEVRQIVDKHIIK